MSHNHPHKNEDEYFVRQNAELIAEMRRRLDAERASGERTAHFMKCPRCGADLEETTFHHMKIDVCPECKGTWLDAGELEMISHVKRSEISRFIGAMLGLK